MRKDTKIQFLRLQRSLSPAHSVTHSHTCSSTCPASKEVSCPGGP
ncbi:hypothetical protein EYF80_060568 [Liparis tanakae]|uniref:Uncharacterized protein n=1 Tax=Liparis tanakae TaxID=230148 RepID=A0A4Z2ELG0_9TELE|nr:hypothetical protein EYF80_060568 [Liparis tanakae]